MIGERTKVFLIGLGGGVMGVVLIIGMIFGFFSIIDKLNRTEIICLPEKEVKKGNLICKVLELKDRGNILKVSEMVSPPTDEKKLQRIKDKTTSGKFIEVKFEIENLGKENQNLSKIVLIDNQNRKFSSFWDLEIEYWLPQERLSSISPGLKKEITEIFEVPKDSADFRFKVGFWKSTGMD